MNLLSNAKKYTESAEAYDLYLKGISYFNKRGPQNIEMAIGYYQQAIAIDPNFALAYASLADAYAQPAQHAPYLSKPECLCGGPDLNPFRMINVLQASRCVSSHRLQMRIFLGCNADIRPCRWNDKVGNSFQIGS